LHARFCSEKVAHREEQIGRPERLLRAAVAKLRLRQQVGCDEPLANFILDANPLDDITNTRTISSVYLRGVAVDRSSYK